MKATHYFKGDGTPCGHIQIKFTVTGEEIAKEIWYQAEHGYVNPEVIHKWKPEKIEKLIRTRFQSYGEIAYDTSEFEAFDNLSTLQVLQLLREAKDKFPGFFDGMSIRELSEKY